MGHKVGKVRRFLILHGATRQLVILVGVIATFLAFSGYVSLVNLARVTDSSDQVVHTLDVKRKANEIFAIVLNAETRARGFLLTGDETFLDRIREEANNLDAELRDLRSLVSDNQKQTDQVTRLETLIRQHKEQLRQITSDDTSGPSRADDLYKSRDSLDLIRALVAEVIQEEQKLLQVRLERAHDSQRLSTWLTVLQTIVGLALVFIGTVVLQKELNARLRGEKQVRRLLAEISEENRRKDEFLATLSHELRNPLAPLANTATLMKRVDPGDPQWQSFYDIHERQLAQLVHLVDDLLDLSRIANNKIAIARTPVDIREVIRDAIMVARGECDAKGVRLVEPGLSEPIRVLGDQVRLLQVLGNLLNNACKFTPKDGQIEVKVQADSQWATIEIADTGRGIAAADLEAIFTMFSQISNADGEMKNGLGIGLTLAKRLVELHGGDLSVRSEGMGKGSVFSIRLPQTDAQNENPAQSQTAGKSMSNLRVLVADDNVDAATAISMLIGTFGAEVTVVHDGEEAVTQALERRPNLMLMDIGMPKMDGIEACRTIRAQSWGKEITIVALTGWGQDRDKERTREAGFTQHLVKPVSLADIEALLEECQKSA